MHGPAPGPWDVVVPYPEKFKNSVSKAEVPHTASVKVMVYIICIHFPALLEQQALIRGRLHDFLCRPL